MSQALQDKFLSFAAYGSQKGETSLDSRSFVKLFKDAGCMVGKNKLTSTDLDLIFSKYKTKGQNKLSFSEFKEALPACAAKKNVSVDELTNTLLGSKPQSNATVPEYSKFHDDTSTYTGVHANGGPTIVDGNKDLSSLCDRSPADKRGVSATSNFNRSR